MGQGDPCTHPQPSLLLLHLLQLQHPTEVHHSTPLARGTSVQVASAPCPDPRPRVLRQQGEGAGQGGGVVPHLAVRASSHLHLHTNTSLPCPHDCPCSPTNLHLLSSATPQHVPPRGEGSEGGEDGSVASAPAQVALHNSFQEEK